MRSSGPASSRPRNTSAPICCGIALRPTCCAKALRSTRLATFCVTGRACQRPSTPSTMSKACDRSRAHGRFREVGHDHAVSTSRSLSRRSPQPWLRSIISFPGRVLRRFTAFADSEGVDHVTVDLFLRWKAAFGSANNNTWSARLGMVRVFAGWLQGDDGRTEVPPPGLIAGKLRRARPYIYSDVEVATIVARAARLPSRYGLRGWTCSTLFGLIAVTGLRINEAIALDDNDVDLDEGVITVRRGKNGTARFVPRAPSTVARLRAYRAERTRLLGATT